MKIKVKESELRKYIKKSIEKHLNESGYYDLWSQTTRYHITEGLTCTYSYGKTKDILQHKYNFDEMNANITFEDANRKSSNLFSFTNKSLKTTQDSDNWYRLNISFGNGIKNYQETIKEIIHDCNACGWYFSHCMCYVRNTVQNIEVFNKDNFNVHNKLFKNTPLKIVFMAKFNAEYKESSVPQFLYHIAPLRVLNKIKRQGLTPRANGRIASHPERVYLFIEKPEDWKVIADEFRKSNINEPYCLLKIYKQKMNQSVKFYYDSNALLNNPAVYTYEPIPPSAISLIDTEENIEH